MVRMHRICAVATLVSAGLSQHECSDTQDDQVSLMQDKVARGAQANTLGSKSFAFNSLSGRHDSMGNLLEEATNMIKSGVTPEVNQFVEDIQSDLVDVNAAILNEHAIDQSRINQKLHELEWVVANFTSDHTDNEVLREQRSSASAEHLQCRSEEGVVCAQTRKCQWELETLWNTVEREERTMRRYHEEVRNEWCLSVGPLEPEIDDTPFNWARTSPYPSIALPALIVEFRSTSITQFTFYMEQYIVVLAAWEAYNAKSLVCSSWEDTLDSKVNACDNLQTLFDSAACSHATASRNTRHALGNEWTMILRQYNQLTITVEQLVQDRKAEFETLHIVNCLLQVIHTHVTDAVTGNVPCITEESHPDETARDIETCHVITDSLTEHLTVFFGSPPAVPELPPILEHPCSLAYVASEHSFFPDPFRSAYTQQISAIVDVWNLTQTQKSLFEEQFPAIGDGKWPGCAAPLACVPCLGLEVTPPNLELTGSSHECRPHELYLGEGGSDMDTFRCWHGDCVGVGARCNGHINCGDGSDEVGCDDPSNAPAVIEFPQECPVSGPMDHLKQCGEVTIATSDPSVTGWPSMCISAAGQGVFDASVDVPTELLSCAGRCGELTFDSGSVAVSATSGRRVTVETCDITHGPFHDRTYQFDSMGSFEGHTFIKYSLDDKSTDSEHVMLKVNIPVPTRFFVIPVQSSIGEPCTDDLPWLASWGEVDGMVGPTYSGVRETDWVSWGDSTTPETPTQYQSCSVFTKTFPAGTVSFPGNSGGRSSYLLLLEKTCYTDPPAPPPPPQPVERVLHFVYSSDGVGNADSLCLSLAASYGGLAGCATTGGVLGCAGNAASDTTLQVCNENDDNQRFGLYRSGVHHMLRSLLDENQCLTVGQSTWHAQCEPFTLAPCVDSERQQFSEEDVQGFAGVKEWRNVGTNLAIDVKSSQNRVNNWIWACPGANAAKYWRPTIPS